MSVIASTDIYNQNDEVLFDKRTLERMKKVDIEELEYESDGNEEQDAEGNGIVKVTEERKARDRGEESDDSMDPDQRRLEEMANGMDEYYSRQKEYKMEVDRQLQKKEKKRKLLIEQQRLKKEDVSEEEELNNDDIRELDDAKITKKKASIKFSEDTKLDSDSESEDDDGLFVNPLLLNQKTSKKGKKPEKEEDGSENSGFSSADEEDERKLKKEKDAKKKREDKLTGKRKKRGDEEDDVGDFFANTEIEVVPQTKIRGSKVNAGAESDEEMEAGYSSMDSEDMAETRALAKVMLRKKNRGIIIDSTYNKFATHEDKSTLPDWFVEDEARHFRPNNVHLVTKDMIAEERKFLKEYNERPSKKVQEAKARKKKRLAKAMNKIKNKATVIAEQQEMSEGSKMKQI